MKRFSIFHVPLLSFFSRSLYRDVAKNWRGICFWYLVLLLILTWLPVLFKWDKSITAFVDNDLPKIEKEMPQIKIKDGELSINKPQPYIVKNPKTKQPTLVVDTTGQIKSLNDTTARLLFTKTQVHVRGQWQTETINLKEVQDKLFIGSNFILDPHDIIELGDNVKEYFLSVGGPVLIFLSIMYRLFQVLIYAVIGLIFTAVCGAKVSFGGLMRLSVVAVTPCIILHMAQHLLGLAIPYAYLGYFVLAMIYLFMGVSSTNMPDAEESIEAEFAQ